MAEGRWRAWPREKPAIDASGGVKRNYTEAIGSEWFDAGDHGEDQCGNEPLAGEPEEQSRTGVLHLREDVGKVDAVGAAAFAEKPIGDRLGDPGEDRREIQGEELGVEVLAYGLGAASGEIIENGLPWVLDVAFREDDSRIRRD